MKKIIVKDSTKLFPPFMINYTDKEIHYLSKFWHLSGHEYITDPLGYEQCLAYQYDSLTWYFKIIFNIMFKVEISYITYEEYKKGFY